MFSAEFFSIKSGGGALELPKTTNDALPAIEYNVHESERCPLGLKVREQSFQDDDDTKLALESKSMMSKFTATPTAERALTVAQV